LVAETNVFKAKEAVLNFTSSAHTATVLCSEETFLTKVAEGWVWKTDFAVGIFTFLPNLALSIKGDKVWIANFAFLNVIFFAGFAVFNLASFE
jgi:hypothetical protein